MARHYKEEFKKEVVKHLLKKDRCYFVTALDYKVSQSSVRVWTSKYEEECMKELEEEKAKAKAKSKSKAK